MSDDPPETILQQVNPDFKELLLAFNAAARLQDLADVQQLEAASDAN
jgi:hypothetical protein